MLPSGPEARVKASAFEGLFIRGLNSPPLVTNLLIGLGVDLHRLEPEYPIKTWHAARSVAGRAVFPTLSEQQADRELGRVFIRGYSQTVIGKIIGVSVPLLGPARMLARLPKLMNTSRSGRGMELLVQDIGPRERLLVARDVNAQPDFNAGMVHEILIQAGADPRVDVVHRTPDGFALRVRW